MERLTNGLKRRLGEMSEGEIKLALYEHEQYKKIEEELGIDLITLFKAMKNGFYAYNNDKYIIELKNKKGNCGAMNFYISHNCIIAEDVFKQQYIYLLKDYGKTWALTKEELKK